MFYFTDTNVYSNSVLLSHFLGIWLSVKYRDFLIISNLSQVLHSFFLLYKDKLKVHYESATCLLCNNVSRLCCTFSWKILITIFNLGHTWCLIKLLLYNESTILDWSEEEIKWKPEFSYFQKVQHVHHVFKVDCYVAFLYFYQHKTSYVTTLKYLKKFL